MSSTSNLTVRIPEELHEKISELAAATERSRNWVVQKALENYVDDNGWQIEQIKAGIASADRGELTPHDDVFTKLDKKVRKRLEKSTG